MSELLDLTNVSVSSLLQTQPLTATPDTTVASAIAQMHRQQARYVLVTQDQVLHGILTENDVVRALASGQSLATLRVVDLMDAEVITLAEADLESLLEVLHKLQAYGVPHLPVVNDQGHPIGVISRTALRGMLKPLDLLRFRRVAEVMGSPGLYAQAEQPLQQIVQMMAQDSASFVVIVGSASPPMAGAQGRLQPLSPVGIITEHDVLRWYARRVNFATTLAQDVMSAPVLTIGSEASLGEVHAAMQHHQIQQLVVTGDRGEWVGTITQTRVLSAYDPVEMHLLIAELQQTVQHQAADLEHEKQQRQSLQQSLADYEARYHSILNNLPDLVSCCQPDGTLTFVNQAYCNYFQRSPEALLGQSFLSFIPPEDHALVQSSLQRLAETCQSLLCEHRITAPDGTLRWHQWNNQVVCDAQGNILEIQSVGRDITTFKQAEASLKANETRFRALVQNSFDILQLMDAEFNVLYTNPALERILGPLPQPFTSHALCRQLHEEDVPLMHRVMAASLGQPETPLTVQYRMRRTDGSWVWIETVLTNWLHHPDVRAIVLNSRNISEHKATEEALHQREREFRALVENAPDVIARFNQRCEFLYINPRVEQTTGIPPHRFIHQTPQALGFPGHIVQLWDQTVASVYQTGQEEVVEYQCSSPDHPPRYYSARIVPEFGDRHQVESVLMVARDVTQRRLAEAAVLRQAQREKALNRVIQAIHHSLDVSTLFATAVRSVTELLESEQTVLTQFLPEQRLWRNVAWHGANAEAPDLTGREVSEVQALALRRLQYLEALPLLSGKRVGGLWGEAESPPKTAQTWLVVRIYLHRLWGCLALRRSHQPWQESEIELTQTIANQLAIAVEQSELYIQVHRLNATLERQVKARTAQLEMAFDFEASLKRITDRVRDSLDESHILQTAVEELAQCLGVNCCNAALFDLEKDTSTICYEHVSAGVSPYRGRISRLKDFPELYEPLLRGEHFQFCSIMPNPLRGRVAMLACPIQDDKGVMGDLWLVKQSYHAFSDQDIRLVQQVANQCAIALRQAQLYQAAQAQVQELERLNHLKDDFLSSVSHELRTPMSNMRMAIQMLEVSLRPTGLLEASETPHRYFRILKEECSRETNLINDLLDLARLDAHHEPLVLNTLRLQRWVQKVIEPFMSRFQQQQQTLINELPADLPPLTTDFFHLERVLGELLQNACKYTPAQESIRLSAQVVPEGMAIHVCNSGVDIPEAELAHVFDKFYRVPKNDPWKHGGTGLGLALVKKLTEHLNGTITAHSGDRWTCFTVTLPNLDPPRPVE